MPRFVYSNESYTFLDTVEKKLWYWVIISAYLDVYYALQFDTCLVEGRKKYRPAADDIHKAGSLAYYWLMDPSPTASYIDLNLKGRRNLKTITFVSACDMIFGDSSEMFRKGLVQQFPNSFPTHKEWRKRQCRCGLCSFCIECKPSCEPDTSDIEGF